MGSHARHHHPLCCGLVLFGLLGLPTGGSAADARSPGGPVRLAFEVAWAPARGPWSSPSRAAGARPVDLSLAGGRILEVVPVAGSGEGPSTRTPPHRQADGTWLLGQEPSGRVRVGVEAPLGADLTLRAAGQPTMVGLVSLLDGPARGVFAGPGATEWSVERLPWDSIQAELGLADGTAEAGAPVPVDLRFNILTPEPAEVALRWSAELRPLGGGEPVWRQEGRGVVATNLLIPPALPTSLTAPGPEGTYLLEVRSDWEPLGDPAGTKLGRWLRRRRSGPPTTAATRRQTLAVVHPHPPAPLPTIKRDGAGVEVDLVDLTHPSGGHRATGSGRAPCDPASGGGWGWSVPDPALDAPAFRERVRNLIGRSTGDPAVLPAPDSSGLAWSAISLRVPHPERPHRLAVTVRAGHPAALGVAVVVPPGPGSGAGAGSASPGLPRLALDACAAGSPVLEGTGPLTFSWPIWPGSEAPVVVLVNRGQGAPVVVGSISLTELTDLPAAGSARPAERSLGLHLASPRELDRFGGVDPSGWVDPLTQARNLATYLVHTGASSVVLPDGLSDRGARRGLGGQAAEDSTGPDRLDLTLRVLARRQCLAWIDLPIDGVLPGLPPVESPEALAGHLVRLDRRGRPDGPSYQPIHPAVREAMARRVAEAVAPRAHRPNLLGVLVRLGPGSTLPGGPDMGLDDATYARFVAAEFESGPAGRVPGRGVDDPARFEDRARFVEAAGRVPWLAWRAREVARVYAALGEAAHRAAPGARLAVATPTLDGGLAGAEARRVDRAGLGPGQAWRGVGLDLAAWPVGPTAPLVFRTSGLSTDDLAHDLAANPELDEPVAARLGRGAIVGVEDATSPPGDAPGRLRLSARPMAEGPAGDEPLGHALAALDAQRVIVAARSAAGQEERLRRFSRVFTALPTPEAGQPAPRLPAGVVARSARLGSETVLTMANDSPYPILLEAVLATSGFPPPVDDLARGVRLDPGRGANSVRVVLELAPFGVTAARIGAPDVRLSAVHPYPGAAVLDGMKAQADDLATLLDRLNRLPAARVGPGVVDLATDRATGLAPAIPALPGLPLPDEAELLNAKRDLRAALTSYREKRYADFARLAGSHWARRVVSSPPPALATGTAPNPAPATATATAAGSHDRTGAIRTGNASALPPSSRLR